jgi:hypothetical protein
MVRTFVLVSAAVFSAAAPVMAQGFAIGVKGGLSIATQHTSGDGGGPALDNRFGAVGGVFAILPLVSRLDLEVDGLYASKGAKLATQGIGSTLQVDYFEVPLLARYRLGGGHQFYVAAGPSLAVRLRARARTDFGGATEEIDVADQVESTDFGIAMGGGLTIRSIVIDGRYTLGRRDIDKDKTDTSRTFNRAIALTAGIRF